MYGTAGASRLNLVLKVCRNIVTKQPAEIMTTKGTTVVFCVDELASSALRVKCMLAITLHHSSIDGNAAVTPSFEHRAQANSAIGLVEILQATAGSSSNSGGCEL